MRVLLGDCGVLDSVSVLQQSPCAGKKWLEQQAHIKADDTVCCGDECTTFRLHLVGSTTQKRGVGRLRALSAVSPAYLCFHLHLEGLGQGCA